MCGIAGIVSLGGGHVDAWAVKRMADELAHRGPDDAGFAFVQPGHRLGDGDGGRGSYWIELADPAFRHLSQGQAVLGGEAFKREFEDRGYSVGLGHRRLSILDLSPFGHQPMASCDKRMWIVHNGEVYNFLELRGHLESRGHVFRTRTDTEVILALWEEYGPESVEMLDGMFAFALYDRVQNALWLCRDRFGVKPVYYADIHDDEGRALVFASEAKALFASGRVRAEFSPTGLCEYLTFQNVLSDGSIWSGVRVLPPGAVLRCEPGSGRDPVMRRVMRPVAAFTPAAPGEDGREATASVAQAFDAAVRRQLVSDVPVGAYLSGGMDSGSIVAVAAQGLDRLHTFTGGFDLTNVNGIEQGFDERALAEQLSFLFQTEHYSVVLHAGDMPAAMERVTWHMDDPRVGMCHQNWYAAKLASRFVKVCLAGTGGDELFAGYPWRYRAAATASSTAAFDDAMFASWHRLLPAGELASVLAPGLRDHLPAARGAFDAVMAGLPAAPRGVPARDALVQRALGFEFETFLHGLLITEDHVSMAHGLETRVPFLDNALAALAWRLPPEAKIDMAGFAGGSGHVDSVAGKLVLRRAMEKYLPASFLTQRKQGFSPPDENWYRGPSMDYIRGILLDRRTQSRPWFDQRAVAARLEEHFEGRRNHRLLIWSLLSLEWVQRHFADAGPIRQEPAVVLSRSGGARGATR